MPRIEYYKELNKDFKMLHKLIDDEYYERFGESYLKYQPYNTLDGIEDFFIAYSGEKPIACGCLRRITEEIAELKRVFVLPEYRRMGVANLLVDCCEETMKKQNFICIRLETGVVMHEAIQLYKKRNYSIVENYGDFVGDEQCCCMEKKL